MYDKNIVLGSQQETSDEKKTCDVVAVFMPDEEIQNQLVQKLNKSTECIDYRSYLPVYQPTTVPFSNRQDIKREKQRKRLLVFLYASIIVLFMTLGGSIGFGIYKEMMS